MCLTTSVRGARQWKRHVLRFAISANTSSFPVAFAFPLWGDVKTGLCGT